MRNYIILNGTNSNTITGLLIQSLAPISKPLMRTEIEEIDGRDGDIITPLGFSAYDKQITIGLYGTYDINAIIAFFNSEGTVTFSNEPDKYYNYQIYDQIDFERLVRFKTATVTLHCQPFKFATTGESQTLTAGAAVSGEGTNIVLEGSAQAPFSQFDLKGNTEQNGTPTSSAPVAVQTVTGNNTVKIFGKNMFDCTGYNQSAGGLTNTLNPDGTITTTGVPTGNYTRIVPNLYITDILEDGVTYTISKTNSDYNVATQVQAPKIGGGTDYYNGTFTVDKSTHSYYLITAQTGQMSAWGDQPRTITCGYQLEKGSAATSFEPYQSQSYNINLVSASKNLFNKDTATTGARIGSNGSQISDAAYFISDWIPVEPNTQYVISPSSYLTYSAIATYKADGTFLRRLTGSSFSSITTESNAAYIRFATDTNNISTTQLEKGSESTTYVACQPIEMCKIGTYQDYIYKDGDNWKIHKEVVKTILNGSESWSSTTPHTNVRDFRMNSDPFGYPATGSNSALALMDKFVGVTNGASEDVECFWFNQSGYLRIALDASLASTVSDFKTWLSNNNVTMYSVLATSTDITITNTALIEQLNAIDSQAHGYNTRTNINSVYATGNVPLILAATVYGDATGTITNAGNIYSKPKLTVYGSGDIGIYLNGVQMFQITLGSDGYITIDTNLMEAYKDNLQTLKNRQVTGDYSNFKLPVGQSTISFSGIVTSCVVENFSRWL